MKMLNISKEGTPQIDTKAINVKPLAIFPVVEGSVVIPSHSPHKKHKEKASN